MEEEEMDIEKNRFKRKRKDKNTIGKSESENKDDQMEISVEEVVKESPNNMEVEEVIIEKDKKEKGERETVKVGENSNNSKPKEDESDKRNKKRRKVSIGLEKDKDDLLKNVNEAEEVWTEPNYKSEDFIHNSILSQNSTISPNILLFYNSYGFDCLKKNNLVAIDEDTIVYSSGNCLHFFSVRERRIKFMRRSASGFGFGHLTLHPSKQFVAVAEKGLQPFIIIYSLPHFKVHRVLRKGTTKGYSYIHFNSTGELLCSQGQDPDYLLTIWNWEKERILLRTKSFSQDVYKARFSPNSPGDLITSGLGHIRFWKMADTFTGLKLLGTTGRFGKTEISDVQGFAALSKGKIISGSEWGNLLIWDEGLIVTEIKQNADEGNCHNGEITDIAIHEEAEILTLGNDGYLKLWDFETIDLATTNVKDSGIYELEPLFQMKFSSTAKLLCCTKSPKNPSIYFFQDSWGKVWKADLSISVLEPDYRPESVFYCPGGKINSVGVSTAWTMMVVGSEGGHLWLIQYITKECLARRVYENNPVTRIIWIPKKYDPRGISFLAGFNDGTLKNFSVQQLTPAEIKGVQLNLAENEEAHPYDFYLNQKLRVAKGRILNLLIDIDKDILYVTTLDKIIFTFRLNWDTKTNGPSLTPLSFVTAPFPVISLDLHPKKDYRMIIAGKAGRVAECRRPFWGELGQRSNQSFNQGKLQGRKWVYTSTKSWRRREERREKRKIERDTKIAELLKEIKRRKSSGELVDEELEVNRINDNFRKMQAAEDEQELFIPEKPCTVFSIYYCINKRLTVEDENVGRTFFLNVGNYDSGYIYEAKCSRNLVGGYHPLPSTPPFTQDTAIKCFTISPDDKYLICGMTDGSIRIMPRADLAAKKALEAEEEKKREELKETVAKLVKEKESDVEDSETDIFVSSQHHSHSQNKNMNEKIEEKDKKTRKKSKKIVSVSPFPSSFFPYDLNNFFILPMHDLDKSVTELAWSHDQRFLFSVGEDGGIFSYRWNPEGKLQNERDDLGRIIIPEIRLRGNSLKDDFNPNEPTLEELKESEEKERIWGLTEGKKEVNRKKLKFLKEQFRALKLKNKELPEEFRLQRREFEIDPRIREPLKAKMLEGLEEVHRKLEWEGARSVVAVEKIENHFFKDIETHYIVVFDISHETRTSTFRIKRLSRLFEDLIEANKRKMDEEELLLSSYSVATQAVQVYSDIPPKRIYAKDLIGNYELRKYDRKTMNLINQLEERLKRRYEREVKWAELNAQKIPENYEAPEDIEAIRYARSNLGDYKLKNSDDFINEKVTIASRRQKILDLKLKIHETVNEFNKEVIGLRNEKHSVLLKCKSLEKKLLRLQNLLPPDLRLEIPQVYNFVQEEEPEKFMDITKRDIEIKQREKIEEMGLKDKFEARKQRKKKKVTQSQKAALKIGRLTGIGLGTGVGGRQRQSSIRSEDLNLEEFKKGHRALHASFIKKGEEEKENRDKMRIQRRLLLKLTSYIDDFKDRVRIVRDKRIKIAIELKLMSIKFINLIQELNIVKEFDSQEKSVLERFKAQKLELQATKIKMEKVKKRLERAISEHLSYQRSLHDLEKEAGVIIGEKPRFNDFLWKVFKKKLKKKSSTASQQFVKDTCSESSSGNSSDSQDSGSDLFKAPKQKLDLNVCPDNLEASIYNRVIELRSKKLRLEIDSGAQSKVVEKINRDFQDVENIHKKYEGRLDDIGLEVYTINKAKQGKINDIKTIAILKASQVKCLYPIEKQDENLPIAQKIEKYFPESLEDVVIFPDNGISKLEKRIMEVKDERNSEKDKHRRASHMVFRLKEELAKLECQVREAKTKSHKEMIGKFGRIVDIDEVYACIINLDILDTLMKSESKRKQQYMAREGIKKQIEEVRELLTQVTRENSEQNTVVAMLTERQRNVDFFLYKQAMAEKQAGAVSQSTMDSDFSSLFTGGNKSGIADEELVDEILRLEEILMRQYARMEMLKNAVAACKVKSGLPPLVPFSLIPNEIGDNFITLQELEAYIARKKEDEIKFLWKNPKNIYEDISFTESEFLSSSFINPSQEPLVRRHETVDLFSLASKTSPLNDEFSVNYIPDDQMKILKVRDQPYKEDPIPVHKHHHKHKHHGHVGHHEKKEQKIIPPSSSKISILEQSQPPPPPPSATATAEDEASIIRSDIEDEIDDILMEGLSITEELEMEEIPEELEEDYEEEEYVSEIMTDIEEYEDEEGEEDFSQIIEEEEEEEDQ